MDDAPSGIACPKCGEPIAARIWARAMDQHRMVISLAPKPGDHLAAHTVGGSLSDIDRLLKAAGREIGVKTLTLLERVETTEAGELRFHLLITNVRGNDRNKSRNSGDGLPAVEGGDDG
ncbi:MAG: hypothetical protein AB7O44_27495 [Hyphomicrobiaceae bacterium]